MQLFNIAIKNVKRNFKNYMMYFFSMTFAVTVYALFKSIEYNKQISTVSKGMKKVGQAFSASSYIVALFVFIFIWYSNSFFIKKRKKEIGVYSLLGIKKRSIGALMFYETMIMGILALIVGIIFGGLLSKGFIQLFMKMIDAENMIKASFTMTAAYETIKAFIIIFLFVSIHGSTMVYRYELIDLFKAESKGEELPKASIVTVISALVLLFIGYLLYILQFEQNMEMVSMITLITVVCGTYLFFSSLLVFYLKAKKKNKNKHYKGLNMISNSQLLYRIKGNSRSLATIAILIATTLTSLGFSISFYKNFSSNIGRENPFDYVIQDVDSELTKKIDDLITNNDTNKLKQKIIITTVNNEVDPKEGAGFSQNLMAESDFEKIAEIKDIELNKKLLTDKDVYLVTRFGEPNKTIKSIELNKRKETYNVVEVKKMAIANGFVLNDVIVVKDEEFNKLSKEMKKQKINMYLVENHNRSGELSEKFNSLIKNYKNDKGVDEKGELKLKVASANYYDVYREEIASTGTLLFIGSFVGLVFLVCTASIIFFKQLSEANEEKLRYLILRKIGVRDSEIKASIYKQMAFIFFLPLAMGICHGAVALSKFGKWLEIGTFTPIILTTIPYTVIYLVYYFLTVKFYYKTVTE